VTKERSEILADENLIIILEKVKLGNFFTEPKIFRNGGNLKNGGNASLPQGVWWPLLVNRVRKITVLTGSLNLFYNVCCATHIKQLLQ